jgi:hypothetical protein
MSVCLAARTITGEIVVAMDQMISFHDGAFTGDSALLKIAYLGGGWSAMAAGNDITPSGRNSFVMS